MEPASDRDGDVNNGDKPAEDKASEKTPANSTPGAPRRALRERGAGRPRSGASAAAAEVNGAASSPLTSGRVLRDRSTRAVPAWLKDSRSDDDDEEEAAPESGAAKRRKVSNSRRKKISDSASAVEAEEDVPADILQGAESEDPKKKTADGQALPSRRPSAQTGSAKPPAGRTARGLAKPVCKTEPGMENPAVVEGEKNDKEKSDAERKKEVEKDAATEPAQVDEEPLFQDDPNDLNYQPPAQSLEEDEALSSDEDLAFRDDLNDQSYDPRDERDAPKPKRRAPLRNKEKKEKDKAPKKEEEVDEIKVESSENVEIVQEEVKMEEEVTDDPDGPRKRGRRKKDDKTPRLPKRRKKPPVQYVRCEMEGCGTVLAHPRYLQHHIKYQHLLKKKYVCPHPSCGRLFRLQKQLLRHAKHHTDQRDYICEFCARAFKSSHNLAVHRMIHTGEKPLQCEICGFTCRQKASLNWHMKKHDADATYRFSCPICGKKFEKKDCVVAHKAKSHPEVLIAEALAANAGALITTPASLLDLPGNPMQGEVPGVDAAASGAVDQLGQDVAQISQMSHVAQQVSHQVVLLGQDQSLHTMQVPVTIALSPIDPPSPADDQQQTHLQLQMPVQFVQTAPQQQQQQQLTLHSGSVVTQHQAQLHPLQPYSPEQQSAGQTQILQMTFQPVSQSQTHIQQIPILASSPQLQTLQTAAPSPPLLSASQSQASTSDGGYILDASSACASHQPTDIVGENSVVWEQTGESEVLSDGTEGDVQQVLI
ncbi:E3 ubiquitin-protein ligase ZFP91 [Oryzias melastigma]|uniref:E3 ubiquitin-protein ligase ZFP91 n=1 Tax=Oryzias melastigma TaxID=30732 RepID=A0A834FGL6_ORYME|nr:E3 ubiquitin-protein ligase ZFP91 isoform X2 [Oryzias melastigma]KAF6733427.1 E3 ubiquitin-protein ligase ZFP91 [Oryzias melastigma]